MYNQKKVPNEKHSTYANALSSLTINCSECRYITPVEEPYSDIFSFAEWLQKEGFHQEAGILYHGIQKPTYIDTGDSLLAPTDLRSFLALTKLRNMMAAKQWDHSMLTTKPNGKEPLTRDELYALFEKNFPDAESLKMKFKPKFKVPMQAEILSGLLILMYGTDRINPSSPLSKEGDRLDARMQQADQLRDSGDTNSAIEIYQEISRLQTNIHGLSTLANMRLVAMGATIPYEKQIDNFSWLFELTRS